MGPWNDSPTVKRWIVICAAFALALLFIACLSGRPAGAVTMDPGTSAIEPVAFTVQATPISGTEAARLFDGTGHHKRTGPCWLFTHDFPVKDLIGKLMYDPGVRAGWCDNPKRTKVTKLFQWDAYDGGGYYNFTSVDKSKGSLGYASLGLSATWHYKWFMGIPGVYDYRSPAIVFSVYTNGHAAGTMYFDN